jgi:hypothetical protein
MLLCAACDLITGINDRFVALVPHVKHLVMNGLPPSDRKRWPLQLGHSARLSRHLKMLSAHCKYRNAARHLGGTAMLAKADLGRGVELVVTLLSLK